MALSVGRRWRRSAPGARGRPRSSLKIGNTYTNRPRMLLTDPSYKNFKLSNTLAIYLFMYSFIGMLLVEPLLPQADAMFFQSPLAANFWQWDLETPPLQPPDTTRTLQPDSVAITGYDCSIPGDVEPVQAAKPRECSEHNDLKPDVLESNVTIALLQKSNFRVLTVKSCRMRETQISHHAGMHSHEIFRGRISHFGKTVLLSQSECRRLHSRLVYTSPNGIEFPMQLNMPNHFGYDAVGEKIEKPDDIWTKKGGTFNHNGTKIERVVQRRDVEILLSTHNAKYKNGAVHISNGGVSLPPSCGVATQACELSSGTTYVWNRPDSSSCNVATTRIVTGNILRDPTGNTAFISTDESKIRFLLKDEETLCGQTVTRTEFGPLFMSRDITNARFAARIRPDETDVNLHASLISSFAASQNQYNFAAVFRELLTKECGRDTFRQQFSFDAIAAAQASAKNGDTARIGGNVFVITSGDISYRFKCKPVRTTPHVGRPNGTCTSGLPVDLDPVQKQIFTAASNIPLETQLYVDSKTHILSHIAAALPCTSTFAPLYQTDSGLWIKYVGGRYLYAETPRQIVFRGHNTTFKWQEFSHKNAGAYVQEDLDRANEFRQTGPLRHMFAGNLALQGAGRGTHIRPGEYIALGGVFKDLPASAFSLSAMFWDLINKVGAAGSIAFGFWSLFNITCGLIDLSHRIIYTVRKRGWGWHVLGCIFPSEYLRQLFGQKKVRDTDTVLQNLDNKKVMRWVTCLITRALDERELRTPESIILHNELRDYIHAIVEAETLRIEATASFKYPTKPIPPQPGRPAPPPPPPRPQAPENSYISMETAAATFHASAPATGDTDSNTLQQHAIDGASRNAGPSATTALYPDATYIRSEDNNT